MDVHEICDPDRMAAGPKPRGPENCSAEQQGATIGDYRDWPTSEHAFEPAGHL
jgi:hypothetical protein